MLSSKWVYISKNNPTFTPSPPPPPSPPYPKLGCSVLFSTARDPLLSTGCLPPDSGTTLFKVARYSFSGSIPPKIEHKLRRHKQRFGKIATNNNEFYLHDHTSTYSIGKVMFIGIKITTQGNYVTLIIICHEHQNKLKYIL